jgi:hypothetical protein
MDSSSARPRERFGATALHRERCESKRDPPKNRRSPKIRREAHWPGRLGHRFVAHEQELPTSRGGLNRRSDSFSDVGRRAHRRIVRARANRDSAATTNPVREFRGPTAGSADEPHSEHYERKSPRSLGFGKKSPRLGPQVGGYESPRRGGRSLVKPDVPRRSVVFVATLGHIGSK